MRPMRFVRLILCFACIWTASASADELLCHGSTTDCSGYAASPFVYWGAGSSCKPATDQPALDPDPIGTFATRTNSVGYSTEGEAVVFSDSATQCMNPIGSNFTGQGTICKYEDPTAAGGWQVQETFEGGLPALATRAYSFNFKVLDQAGQCGIVKSVQAYSISQGRRLECPPGTARMSSTTTSICTRPRICPQCKVGKPIALGTYEEGITEKDYEGGGPFPLRVVRNYGSQAGNALGEDPLTLHTLGHGWRTQYHRGVFVFNTSQQSLRTVRREDGENRVFRQDPQTGLTGLPLEKGRLEDLGSSGWRYTTPDDDVELYDQAGKLQSIRNRDGLTHSIQYDGARVSVVSDDFGRQLVFSYDPITGLLASIATPDGTITYSYNKGALEKVTRPDGSVRQYLYAYNNMPWAITAIREGTDPSTPPVASMDYDHVTTDAIAGLATSTGLNGARPYVITGQAPVGNPPGITTPSVTDPGNTTRTYEFTSSASARSFLLTTITQPRIVNGVVNGTTSQIYTYDTNGNVLNRTDDAGNVTHYTVDTTRNLETQRIEAQGTPQARTITTEWLSTARVPKRIAEPLRITTYAYNGEPAVSCAPTGASTVLVCSKTVQATTDANGSQAFQASSDGAPRTTSYTYDVSGHVLTIDGPRTDVTDVTTMTYYANNDACVPCRGQLRTVTNALGRITTFANYFGSGRVQKMVDPNGLETLFDYWQNNGQLKSRQVGTAAAGYVTTLYNVDSAGLLKKVTQPDGSFVQYDYDSAQRLIKVSDGLGNRIQYTLDDMGNRQAENWYDSTNQPQGVLVRKRARTFDVLNRLATEKFGDVVGTNVNSNAYAYDDNGNVQSIADYLTGKIVQTWDPLNRLIKVIDRGQMDSTSTRYQYNGQNQVTTTTDPANLSTTYSYNGHGELLAQSSPDTGSTTFTYDAASNVKTKTDARGVTATYSYDALNRLFQISYPDETVTYTYDCTNNLGRLCSINDRSGTTTYTYDLWGRVTSKTQVVGTVTHKVSYGYNTAGQLTTITLPSKHQVFYTYSNNRPISVKVDGTTILDGVFYEPFGPNGGWRWGNNAPGAGNYHTRVYDTDFRATHLTSDLPPISPTAGGHFFDRYLSWDPKDFVVGINDLRDQALYMSYVPDSAGRLSSATQGGSTSTRWTYWLTESGDRYSLNFSTNSTINYTYFPGTHRLQSFSGAASETYGYDAAGNVTSLNGVPWTYGGNNRPTQAGTTGFLFNALGQRVKKSTPNGNFRFVYDEGGRLLGEYYETGGSLETIWLEDLPVAAIR